MTYNAVVYTGLDSALGSSWASHNSSDEKLMIPLAISLPSWQIRSASLCKNLRSIMEYEQTKGPAENHKAKKVKKYLLC